MSQIEFLVPVTVEGVAYAAGQVVPESEIPAGSIESLLAGQRPFARRVATAAIGSLPSGKNQDVFVAESADPNATTHDLDAVAPPEKPRRKK